MSFLVERGADINAVNARGQTPWLIAAKGEYRSGSFNTKPKTAEILGRLGRTPRSGTTSARTSPAPGRLIVSSSGSLALGPGFDKQPVPFPLRHKAPRASRAA